MFRATQYVATGSCADESKVDLGYVVRVLLEELEVGSSAGSATLPDRRAGSATNGTGGFEVRPDRLTGPRGVSTGA